jgi:hypothetical protein
MTLSLCLDLDRLSLSQLCFLFMAYQRSEKPAATHLPWTVWSDRRSTGLLSSVSPLPLFCAGYWPP